LLVDERHHLLGHDVAVLELVIDVANQLEPRRIVFDDVAKGMEEERALEILILVRTAGDAALHDNRLLVGDLGLVAVGVLQRIVVTKHVFHVKALEVRRPAFLDPHVGLLGGRHGVAEPLVRAFVDDDEVELEADANAGPVALEIAIRVAIPVCDRALMLHP
jgi:hypothetical protein